MTYDKCNKALQSAIAKMAERCGRLRNAGAPFVNKDQEALSTMCEGLVIEIKTNQRAVIFTLMSHM